MPKKKPVQTFELYITPISGITKSSLMEFLEKLPDDASIDIDLEWGYYENIDNIVLRHTIDPNSDEEKAKHLQVVAKNMYSC